MNRDIKSDILKKWKELYRKLISVANEENQDGAYYKTYIAKWSSSEFVYNACIFLGLIYLILSRIRTKDVS